MPIARLQQLALAVPDPHASAADYAVLLDQPPVATDNGALRLQCENIGLVLDRAQAPDPAATSVTLLFAVPDFAKALHRLTRRGLAGTRSGSRHDLDATATHGVAIGILEGSGPGVVEKPDGDIVGLDHVVVRTPDAERAVALYGGRLGLDLRLDRTREELGVRQLFFVLGGIVVEVVQSTKEAVGAGQDSIWGLAWRSRCIESSHRRMLAAGVGVSGIRDGRKAGTRVFTVKSHAAGIPTLIIGGEHLDRA